MWRRFFMVVFVAEAFVGTPVVAEQQSAPVHRAQHSEAPVDVLQLAEILRLGDLMDEMAQEGINGANVLAGDMFQGTPPTEWQNSILEIYDADRMTTGFTALMGLELSPDGMAETAVFFKSALGQKILSLEISARQAFQDENIEAAAQESYAELARERGPRQQAIERYITVNNFVDNNVMGSMNSNFAYLSALAAKTEIYGEMTEQDLLRMVWQDEGAIRAATTEWLYAYSTLAYQPLSVDEINAYADFSETPAGKEFNRVLFSAFDVLYRQIMRDLAGAVAVHVNSQEL